jgi:hypothetical protein
MPDRQVKAMQHHDAWRVILGFGPPPPSEEQTKLLAERLLKDEQLSLSERKQLVAAALSRWKKPRSAAKAWRRYEIASIAVFVRARWPEQKQEAIVDHVARHFGVSPRLVYQALRDLSPERRKYMEAAAKYFADCDLMATAKK